MRAPCRVGGRGEERRGEEGVGREEEEEKVHWTCLGCLGAWLRGVPARWRRRA